MDGLRLVGSQLHRPFPVADSAKVHRPFPPDDERERDGELPAPEAPGTIEPPVDDAIEVGLVLPAVGAIEVGLVLKVVGAIEVGVEADVGLVPEVPGEVPSS